MRRGPAPRSGEGAASSRENGPARSRGGDPAPGRPPPSSRGDLDARVTSPGPHERPRARPGLAVRSPRATGASAGPSVGPGGRRGQGKGGGRRPRRHLRPMIPPDAAARGTGALRDAGGQGRRPSEGNFPGRQPPGGTWTPTPPPRGPGGARPQPHLGHRPRSGPAAARETREARPGCGGRDPRARGARVRPPRIVPAARRPSTPPARPPPAPGCYEYGKRLYCPLPARTRWR